MGVTPIAVPHSLSQVLTAAGDKSGVDFDYLLQTAIRESSLNPEAKARTSSAVGLFQFLESTWLEVMKSDGPRLGYQRYADAIVNSGGQYSIKDKALRAEVLKLREDPQIAADLAAAFTKNNGDYLAERFGRMPSAGELYIAHFLGAAGAAKMFDAGLSNPDQIAAKLFPRQASANPTIFYDSGKARTIREVYKALVAKHLPSAAPVTQPAFAVQQMAYQGTLPTPAPLEVPASLRPGSPPPQVAAAPKAQTVQTLPPPDVIPSRFGPEVSFTSLFANNAPIAGRRLLTEPEPPAAGGFFTQLYGQ